MYVDRLVDIEGCNLQALVVLNTLLPLCPLYFVSDLISLFRAIACLWAS